MQITILAKVGQFAVKQGEGKTDGRPWYCLSEGHKDKDGEWQNQEIYLFPAQIPALIATLEHAQRKLIEMETNEAQERADNYSAKGKGDGKQENPFN